MQRKYLDQYDDLYGEDMHLVQMPLLSQEVRGIGSLASFGKMLLEPYQPPSPPGDPFARVEQLEAQVASLKAELAKTR
jgi:anion-transporting  ArsA/GET3 family ATPase